MLAAAVLVACVDGTGPGRFGQLRIRPSYTAGDEPGAIGAGLDSAAVRVTRVTEPTVPLIDTTVAYQSDTASLGWILDLREETESLHVAVTLWGGTTQLYDGDGDVQVRDGAIGSAAVVEPVPVAYVGPAIVATVTVSPENASLDAIGATTSLAAEGRDRHGAIVADATFSWTSSNETVATVDPQSGVVTARGNGSTVVTASSGPGSGGATLTVSQRVAGLTVTPGAITLTALGTTHTLTAQATDPNGHAVTGAAIAWTSDAPGIASVDAATGRVTAVAGGAATITAASAGQTATSVVTVNPIADVTSIVVSPAETTLFALGATRQFTAVARDAAGAVLEGVQFTWASSATGVATVDAATGLATATGHGTVNIMASAGAVTGTAKLVVDLSTTIASVTVTPATATLGTVGATQAFAATARDAGGAIVPVAAFAWSSSATAVATIDATNGQATAVSHGVTTITATVAGVAGTATLTVDLIDVVASVTVTPATKTLHAVGATQQFTAVALDAGGAVVPGIPFAWSSSAPSVATVAPSGGLATAVGHGTTEIIATVGGAAGTASLTVELTASVVSVTVTPASDTVTFVGATQQFNAVARDAQDSVLPGVTFVWASAQPSVAAVDASGLATAAGHGITTISATANGVSGTATLTVNLAAVIATVTVTPAADTLTTVGATQAFTATAHDAGGAIVPVAAFVWSSGTPGVATVDPASGVATAASHGITLITATVAGVAGTATLTVDLTTAVASVTVTPGTATLHAVGATQQFTAVARDMGGDVVPGVPFVWVSSAPGVAVVDSITGLATAVGHGATTITAAVASVAGTAALTVDLTPTVASITVTPDTATLTVLAATRQFAAVARDAGGAVVPGVSFVWTSGTTAVATVDAITGLATAAGHGTTVITATIESVSGTASLTVDLAAVIASVTVTPAATSLTAVGATEQFTAVARDAGGVVVPVAQFTWTSSVPQVATIDSITAIATAVGHGVTSISAAVAGQSGSATLPVSLAAQIAGITVTPAAVTVSTLGATQQFTAVARNGAGAVVPVAQFTWASSLPAVAAVNPASGLATAVGLGTTLISASVDGVSGAASFTVDPVASVVTVTVTPSYVTLKALGATQQFTAVARDSAGNVVPGVAFTWSSSEPHVATVDSVTGLATAHHNGMTYIAASVGGVTGKAYLKVEQKVVSVVVLPETVTLVGKDKQQQFSAQAFDANGHVVPGVTFTWSSSNTSIAKVSQTGLATTCSYGTVKIKATTAGVTGWATLVVTRPY